MLRYQPQSLQSHEYRYHPHSHYNHYSIAMYRHFCSANFMDIDSISLLPLLLLVLLLLSYSDTNSGTELAFEIGDAAIGDDDIDLILSSFMFIESIAFCVFLLILAHYHCDFYYMN